jgi:Tfp pilus assembly protein PilV
MARLVSGERGGFGLVELVVAAVLLATGVLVLTGVAITVRTHLHTAAADAAAVRWAAALADSLRAATSVEAGTAASAAGTASWRASNGEFELELRYRRAAGWSVRWYRIRPGPAESRSAAP